MEEFIVQRRQTPNGEILFITEDELFTIWRYYSWLDTTTIYNKKSNEVITFKGFIPLERILEMKAFL